MRCSNGGGGGGGGGCDGGCDGKKRRRQHMSADTSPAVAPPSPRPPRKRSKTQRDAACTEHGARSLLRRLLGRTMGYFLVMLPEGAMPFGWIDGPGGGVGSQKEVLNLATVQVKTDEAFVQLAAAAGGSESGGEGSGVSVCSLSRG